MLQLGYAHDPIAPRTCAEFKERVMSELQTIGLNTHDAETSTKIRICIFSRYGDYRSGMTGTFSAFVAQKEAEALIDKGTSAESASVLSRVNFPKDILHLQVRNSFLVTQLEAIAHVQDSMVYETTKETNEALKALIFRLSDEYKKFHDTEFNPKMQDFKKTAAESIAIFKKELEKDAQLARN